jgi:hypothetical protein
MRRAARFLLAAALLSGCCFLSPKVSVAAPFCVESVGLTPECWYYDVNQCKKEAGKIHARCSANLREITVSAKGVAFCVVDSTKRPECAFQNRESCEDAAARRSGAICFETSAPPDKDSPLYGRLPAQPENKVENDRSRKG